MFGVKGTFKVWSYLLSHNHLVFCIPFHCLVCKYKHMQMFSSSIPQLQHIILIVVLNLALFHLTFSLSILGMSVLPLFYNFFIITNKCNQSPNDGYLGYNKCFNESPFYIYHFAHTGKYIPELGLLGQNTQVIVILDNSCQILFMWIIPIYNLHGNVWECLFLWNLAKTLSNLWISTNLNF